MGSRSNSGRAGWLGCGRRPVAGNARIADPGQRLGEEGFGVAVAAWEYAVLGIGGGTGRLKIGRWAGDSVREWERMTKCEQDKYSRWAGRGADAHRWWGGRVAGASLRKSGGAERQGGRPSPVVWR